MIVTIEFNINNNIDKEYLEDTLNIVTKYTGITCRIVDNNEKTVSKKEKLYCALSKEKADFIIKETNQQIVKEEYNEQFDRNGYYFISTPEVWKAGRKFDNNDVGDLAIC